MTTPLKEYLDYYQNVKSPGYAVLVTGEWGTGKTHQVKQCIPKDKRYYVSLFGIQSIEQLHAEVFAVASPNFAKVKGFIKGASDATAAVGGVATLAGSIPSVANALLRKTIEPDRVLIFDDLERSNLDIKDVLGAIHSYVDQQGFCVIVIAHDKKMTKKFSKRKEKNFGQTIRVEPQIEGAMDSFLREVTDSKAKTFLDTHKDAILDIFKSSKINNLRILRHVVHDIGRLVSTLTDTHLGNADAMLELVQLFTAFDIETRKTRIGEKALINRRGISSGYYMRKPANTENPPKKPPLMVADELYPTIELEEGMLNDDVLVAMFIHGRYPVDEIRGSLDNSAYFIKPDEAPPWKVVISFDRLDDAVVNKARDAMEKQFTDRSVTNPGEMLHIFALKMMMAEHGIGSHSINDVIEMCKAYIDDLLQAEKLPPHGTNWNWFRDIDHAHEGQMYWVSDALKSDFEKLLAHLKTQMEAAFAQQAPKIATGLLGLLETDPKQFFEQVSQTNNGENPYAYIPLLHHIPADDFVDKWLAAPNENWREISYALENRYSSGQADRELSPEKDWAINVYSCLKGHADEAEGFNALRIHRIIPKTLVALAETD